MYERSAIVLERCLDKVFGFNKDNNMKNNIENFNALIKVLKEYQTMVGDEERVLTRFDEAAKELEEIQKIQEKLSHENQVLEDARNKLFNELDANPNIIQSRLEKIENKVEENNEKSKRLKDEYIKKYVIFIERQKERNKFARGKRMTEANYMAQIRKSKEIFKNISVQDMQKAKRIFAKNREQLKVSIINAMLRNGKNEKIPFNEGVFGRAVSVRIDIAEREVESYLLLYDRFKRVLTDIENEIIKIEKYEKTIIDNNIKLTFLNSEKDYIVGFLDNERMTVIGGPAVHKKMMEEACKNFELDINQINNLYTLIVKEIEDKATKKAYDQLYNKTYLRDIEEKERKFEKEVTNIKVNVGTVVNSNYWRIEGIKNVYDVFQEEVTEKFNKDLSDYQIEEVQETKKTECDEDEEKIKKLIYGDIEGFDEEYFDNLDKEDTEEDEYDEELDKEEYEDDYEEIDEDDYDEDDEEYDEEDEELDEDEYEEDEELDDDDYEEDDEEYDEDDEELDDDYEEDDEEYDEDDEELDDDEEINVYKNNYNTDEEDEEDDDRIVSILTRISKEYDEKIKKAQDSNNEKIARINQEDEEDNPGFFNKLFKKS